MNSVISFFTGAGFLDLGFEHAGFRVDMVNEYDPEFLRGYRHARRATGNSSPRYGYHLGSVEEFSSGKSLERLLAVMAALREEGRRVGFIGGPPCPDFSVAGKQAGVEGGNGRLSVVYADLIKSCRPDFFVFENVKGLWSTRKHREFYESMKSGFRQSGYMLNDRLVNALNYGVPQDRDRIFLVGALQAEAGVEFPWERHMREGRSDDLTRLEWPGIRAFDEASPEEAAPPGVPKELTVEHWFRRNDVRNHPNGDMAFVPRSARIKEVEEGNVKKKSFKRLHRWRYSPTAAYGNNEVHLHPYLPRRLSVAEALAIQSLPAEFSLPTDMPLSKCFKTIGNGVPYLAALGLARSIADHLEASETGRTAA